MPVTVAKHAGFCFGVKRATDFVESLTVKEGAVTRIYTIGSLIHNRIYNESLEKAGVSAIEIGMAEQMARAAKDEGRNCVFVIRTHGIPKEDEALLRRLEATESHVKVADMTCPFVKRIHKIAAEETGPDTRFLLLGTPTHPEVLGIMSYARGEAVALPTAKEAEEYLSLRQKDQKKLILAAQTTQNLQEWKKTENFIKKLYTNAIFFDTICNVTESRQTEAIALSKACDRMIVVGGADSANTRKLYELCKQSCPDTVLAESASDLPDDYKQDATKNVGIAAGASTPRGIILEVYKTMENFEQMLEESLKTLHTGETVTGIVTAIAKSEVYLDLGAKVTGIIAYDQITDESGVDLHDLFTVGSEVRAFVIRVDDGKGVATLSKKRVDNDKSWEKVVALSESGETVEGKVVDAIKGGVLLLIDGFKVFVPASQTGLAKGEDLAPLVGTTQKVRVIEIDKQKKRAVASIRAIQREERKAAEEAIR
ncbi:MAG: 4-hydroxy-3-methylbut-2-enyl diphosphate reductase, partial [Clostridia bacterium]|nr:4-hydroxy-3-methylbut-2-enyl diphosphate reductase [Clostridia bacterium]